jgi:hypothetical protein
VGSPCLLTGNVRSQTAKSVQTYLLSLYFALLAGHCLRLTVLTLAKHTPDFNAPQPCSCICVILQTAPHNHLVHWDLRPLRSTGSRIEKICDLAHITLNKNVCHSFGSPSLFSLPSSLVSRSHLTDLLSLCKGCCLAKPPKSVSISLLFLFSRFSSFFFSPFSTMTLLFRSSTFHHLSDRFKASDGRDGDHSTSRAAL